MAPYRPSLPSRRMMRRGGPGGVSSRSGSGHEMGRGDRSAARQSESSEAGTWTHGSHSVSLSRPRRRQVLWPTGEAVQPLGEAQTQPVGSTRAERWERCPSCSRGGRLCSARLAAVPVATAAALLGCLPEESSPARGRRASAESGRARGSSAAAGGGRTDRAAGHAAAAPCEEPHHGHAGDRAAARC